MARRPRDAVTPTQLVLPLRLEEHAAFETLVDGDNGPAVAHVRALAEGAGGDVLWLWGPRGAGKSHLLQAACRAADAAGRRAMYLPLDGSADVAPASLAGLGALEFLAVDGLERAAGRPEWERALFDVLDGFQSRDRCLLLAADRAPAALGFALPDLASRAAGAVVYRLHPLADADQLRALRLHAGRRGLTLSDDAARFLQSRVQRDMRELCAWLARLDAASLAAQRRITIPFIRASLAASPGSE